MNGTGLLAVPASLVPCWVAGNALTCYPPADIGLKWSAVGITRSFGRETQLGHLLVRLLAMPQMGIASLSKGQQFVMSTHFADLTAL